ncbi:MAG: acetylglutamate kinase [Sporolactobacillus sp.]
MKHYLVIKCGGSIYDKLTPSFFNTVCDIQKAGIYAPIIVHGGGPAISEMLTNLAIPNRFCEGLRYTSQAVLDVAEMILCGSMNKQLVTQLQVAGGKAVGLSGMDGNLLTAQPINLEKLGFVGTIASVDPSLIQELCSKDFIPVISPSSADKNGQHYNINADQAAAAIAAALQAKLCFISDVPGILVEHNGAQMQLTQVSDLEIETLIETKKISGGMIPKVMAAVESLKQQVPEVVIVSGLAPQSLVDYTNGQPVGTKIYLEEEPIHACQ